jgi:lysophospholipase L1-like esterase
MTRLDRDLIRCVGHRFAGLLPGVRERRRQTIEYADAWRAANDEARRQTAPLWVVLGDSTAQAIGATTPVHGYVGQVRDWLQQRDSCDWRVLNLSRTGATAADVVAEQLPQLAMLTAAELVSCAVGANDLLRRRGDVTGAFARIAEALPPGALLANLPRGLRESRAALINDEIKALVLGHGLRLVDLWATTGPPWRHKFSRDGFHPNDLGYRDWAAAFRAALGEPGDSPRTA